MLITRVPRYIRDGDLMLRPLRIGDGPFLARMLAHDDVLRSCGASSPPDIHWLTLYRHLRAIFFICYCIEHASERIGFAGLYNLRADKSAAVSLMIFERSSRRCGLGTKSFRMLTAALTNITVIEKLFVTVQIENVAARAFWRRLGFEEISCTEEALEACLPLAKLTQAVARRPDETPAPAEECFRQSNA